MAPENTQDAGREDVCDSFCFNEELVARLQSALPEEETVRQSEAFFSALGSRTRLLVLFCLTLADELCVCDVANALEMNLSTISHQLRHLRNLGLVQCRREGKMAFYRLGDPRVEELLESELGSSTEEET